VCVAIAGAELTSNGKSGKVLLCIQGSYRSGKTGKKSGNLGGQGKVGGKYFFCKSQGK